MFLDGELTALKNVYFVRNVRAYWVLHLCVGFFSAGKEAGSLSCELLFPYWCRICG